MEITRTYLNDLVYKVIGAAIEVHKSLGPGLLENVYHRCIEKELALRNISFVSEINVPVNYKGLKIKADLRCDLFVENILSVELKAVDYIMPINKAQILTYMQLLKSPMGLLINFNVTNIFSQGQQTFVNNLFRELHD
jgi:GxxExxY protein